MNISHSTSQDERTFYLNNYAKARKMKQLFMTGLITLCCFTLSPAWAGNDSHGGTSAVSIQLTGLSIYVGPGGVHLGLGVPSYGRDYGRPHLRPFAKRYWKHQKRHRYGYSYGSAKRYGHRHGWKNERHRGKFRGERSHRRHRH